MDARRTSRMVIDPKARQVGCVTPDAPPDRTQSRPAAESSPSVSDSSAKNSLSPVMIPPLRHPSDNLSASLGAAHPIPVPLLMLPADNHVGGAEHPCLSTQRHSSRATASDQALASNVLT